MISIEKRACRLTAIYWQHQDQAPTIAEIVDTYQTFVEKLQEIQNKSN